MLTLHVPDKQFGQIFYVSILPTGNCYRVLRYGIPEVLESYKMAGQDTWLRKRLRTDQEGALWGSDQSTDHSFERGLGMDLAEVI